MATTKWTEAAKAAFLAELAVHGEPRRAAASVGLSVQSAYVLRRREPGFAAEWAAAKPPPAEDPRVRADGWTAPRRKTFLRVLRETGCVSDAAKRAGLSTTSAYRLRGKCPDFAEAWNRAQAKGLATIEQAAFERAVTGWDEVVTRGGEEVSTKRRYSDSLLRVLLQRGDLSGAREGMSQAELENRAAEFAKAAGGWFSTMRDETGARERLTAKLEAMHARMMAGKVDCPHCGGRGLIPAPDGAAAAGLGLEAGAAGSMTAAMALEESER
jgi:hypothetical protein